MHHAHAAATTTTRCLDDHRVADVTRDAVIVLWHVAQWSAGAGHAGDASLLHDIDGRYLVAHHADHVGARADEREAALLDPLGEIRVLRQETVTRMNPDRVGYLGGADDRRHVEVALLGLRRTDTHRLVGQQHMLEVVIGRG